MESIGIGISAGSLPRQDRLRPSDAEALLSFLTVCVPEMSRHQSCETPHYKILLPTYYLRFLIFVLIDMPCRYHIFECSELRLQALRYSEKKMTVLNRARVESKCCSNGY